jgi:uncharacterized protein YbjT (DUF2867 family)
MTTLSATNRAARTALVTGASGYIGGLLVPRLLTAGWRVRALTRNRSSLEGRPWVEDVEVIEGDAAWAEDLPRALDGVRVAYFLIHAMGGGRNFAATDRRNAEAFAAAARDADVTRIVYLGGLHPDGEELSPHLASRVEVGEILLGSGVPTAVLQAAVVLGDGSASFDMLRYLAVRLPVMVAPRWLENRVQPIAVDDVLHHLVCAADLPAEVNRTLDIGGPTVLTYGDMLRRFAMVTGLRKRLIITVPVLTPGLASRWIGLVTPLDTHVAKPLVGSLIHEVVCREHDIARYVPDPPGGLVGFDAAVRAATQDAPPDHGLRDLGLKTFGAALGAATCWTIARQLERHPPRRADRERAGLPDRRGALQHGDRVTTWNSCPAPWGRSCTPP